MQRQKIKATQWPRRLRAYRLDIEGRDDRVELMTPEQADQRNLARSRSGFPGIWEHDPFAVKADLTAPDHESVEDRPIKRKQAALLAKFNNFMVQQLAVLDRRVESGSGRWYAVRLSEKAAPFAAVRATSREDALCQFVMGWGKLIRGMLRLRVPYYTEARKRLKKKQNFSVDELKQIYGNDLPFKVESFEALWRRRRQWARQQKEKVADRAKELIMSKKSKKSKEKLAHGPKGSKEREASAVAERANWNGHAMTAVLRHCGERGYTRKQAKAIMEHCGFEPADATITIQMGRGKKGESPVDMSKAHTKELAAIAKNVKEDKPAKGGKSKKSSGGKKSSKKSSKVRETEEDADDQAEDAAEEDSDADADEEGEEPDPEDADEDEDDGD